MSAHDDNASIPVQTENVVAARGREAGTGLPSTKKGVTVVVPCFNEEASLPLLFDRLVALARLLADRYDLHFLLIDDGSTDNTRGVLRAQFGRLPCCRVLERHENHGIAATITTGLREALTEVVCSVDADCSYDPLQLERMIPLLGQGVGLVTASPYHPQGRTFNIPAWRLALSKAASFLYRRLLRSQFYCYTSCFRVYRSSIVKDIELRHTGFVGIAELIWQLDKRGVRIVECPAALEMRRHGASKMKTATVMAGHFRLLARVLCERIRKPAAVRLTPFPPDPT